MTVADGKRLEAIDAAPPRGGVDAIDQHHCAGVRAPPARHGRLRINPRGAVGVGEEEVTRLVLLRNADEEGDVAVVTDGKSARHREEAAFAGAKARPLLRLEPQKEGRMIPAATVRIGPERQAIGDGDAAWFVAGGRGGRRRDGRAELRRVAVTRGHDSSTAEVSDVRSASIASSWASR